MMNQKIIVTALASAILAGCGTFDIKGSNYGCSGMQEGAKCLSVTEVYSATESTDFVTGDTAQIIRDKNTNQAQEKGETTLDRLNPVPVVEAVPAADKPTPIRHPAHVMRVWINSFEDMDGDLFAGQYVFTEIEPRRWSIGTENESNKSGLNPLESGRNSIRETESPLSANN